MANNPYISKKDRERLAADLDKYIGKGKSIEQLGFQMKKESSPFTINPECVGREKLPPSMTRESYG